MRIHHLRIYAFSRLRENVGSFQKNCPLPTRDFYHLFYDHPDSTGVWAIWKIALEDGQPLRLFPGLQPAYSPTGDEIAFVRDGDIWIFESASATEYQLVDDPREAYWPTWSPDGKQLAFVSYRDSNGEIYVINRDGTGVKNLTKHPGFDHCPAWRP